MAELVLFTDAAALVLGHLATQLDTLGHPVPTGSRVPNPRPPEFVVVRRFGGTRTSVVTEAALLVVECWAATQEDASDLAELVRSVLLAMQGTVVDGIPVYRVDDVGGPADAPDELSDQPRYTFSVSVTLRGRT